MAARYRGRFAPSPSGPLHFGSLVAAVASYLDARHHEGEWLVRMEDLDRSREKPGAADAILRQLEVFGLHWDGSIIRQSTRDEAYAAAFEQLQGTGLSYACACTRSEIRRIALRGVEGPVYPGTCRGGHTTDREGRGIRLRTDDAGISFRDRIQGVVKQHLESDIGDFIVRRAEGYYAYQLAVVVDDAWQEITHVVRGADLLVSTPRQVYLQQLLELPIPVHAHVPLVLDGQGRKLSKSDAAHPVTADNPLETLDAAMRFLGQPAPEAGSVREFWELAIPAWDLSGVPRPVARRTQ
ncbi:MAG: tRNA glutamyl-Q(34) synthetase GluQRS [Pseudomonadota bacterium]